MLLAFDTSSPTVSVALHDGQTLLAERTSSQPMRHGEQLAPLLVEVLDAAGVDRQELSAIAVGVGPGPFTGLRVGLVTARTLALVLGIPVHGACSLDVLAAEAAATAASDLDGGFLVATDARRKEVYLASYDARGARVAGPEVDKPAARATHLPVVGEGGRLYPEAFPDARGPWRPSAGWLARSVTEGLVERLDPEPLYLRRPDAVAPAAPKRVS